jgi:hypothetical protein
MRFTAIPRQSIFQILTVLASLACPFWIMLLLVCGRLDNGMIPFWRRAPGLAATYEKI